MACKQALILLTLVTFSSCTKDLSTEELRSHLRSAISLAGETDVLIGQIGGHRLSPEFQSGHAGYLRDQAEKEAEDLRKSKAQPEQAQVVQLCIDQLDLLARDLTAVKERKADERALSAFQQRVTLILKTLNAAQASL